MDEEVFDALKKVRDADAIVEIWPDFPCTKCHKDGGRCTSYTDCPAWVGWFGRAWREECDALCVRKRR